MTQHKNNSIDVKIVPPINSILLLKIKSPIILKGNKIAKIHITMFRYLALLLLLQNHLFEVLP